MANIHATVKQLLREQERRNLAQQISATIRQVDILERRQQITRDFAPRLARLIVEHDAARQKLADPAVQRDSRLSFWSNEVKVLGEEISKKVKFYLQEQPDPDLLRLGEYAWAKQVLRRAAAPGSRPSKASRGTCARCAKTNQVLNQRRLCGVCQIEANTRYNPPPKGRTKRASVGTDRRQQELMRQLFSR